jgi:hypothetical protein
MARQNGHSDERTSGLRAEYTCTVLSRPSRATRAAAASNASAARAIQSAPCTCSCSCSVSAREGGRVSPCAQPRAHGAGRPAAGAAGRRGQRAHPAPRRGRARTPSTATAAGLLRAQRRLRAQCQSARSGAGAQTAQAAGPRGASSAEAPRPASARPHHHGPASARTHPSRARLRGQSAGPERGEGRARGGQSTRLERGLVDAAVLEAAPARGTRRVRLVRGEGRGVST